MPPLYGGISRYKRKARSRPTRGGYAPSLLYLADQVYDAAVPVGYDAHHFVDYAMGSGFPTSGSSVILHLNANSWAVITRSDSWTGNGVGRSGVRPRGNLT